MACAEDVAKWMAMEVGREGLLYQQDAAAAIQQKFGTEFTYDNASGNLAIDRAVLREFQKLTEATVVWERGERYWRKREEGDLETRMQN